MPTSIDGLISGLSTTNTINQLMAVERQSQTRLTAKRTANDSLIGTYQALNSRMLAMKDGGTNLKSSTAWQVTKATSSDTAVATATTTSTARAGNLTFRVDRLATTHALVSAGSVSSTDAVIATPNSHYLVSAASALGVSQLTSSSDLALGSHTLTVTQSSGGATERSSVLGTSVTIGAGATIEIATDGSTSTTQTLSLVAGTYTRTALESLVTAASGGSLKATFGNDGKLALATTREGSAAKLAITGGTALASLGLATSTAAVSGIDGKVTVGTTSTTITDISAGSTATFAAATGSINATLSGGLRAGTSKVANVDLGDAKLTTVTDAINNAGAGFRATTVQVSAGTYRLQLAATGSGEVGRITSDTTVFDTVLGGMQTLTTAADAQLTVGSGAAAYAVTSSDNRAEILPGVTVALVKAAPTTDVTINVVNDADAIATKVSSLIDSVNGALDYITSQSRYDTSTRRGGPLLGDGTAQALQRQIYDAFGTIGGGPAALGIKLGSAANINFDRAKFIAAYQADPAAVEAAFTNATTGFAARAETVAKSSTEAVTGLLTTKISGSQTQSKTLTEQITSWDTRLALREASLRRTFGNLEVALGRLQGQSTRLAGEIKKLG
jgi:flagellar hook-associated protein 2